MADLNRLYAAEPALHDLDCEPSGFEWAVADDSANSVIAYVRRSREGEPLLVAVNMTPVPRHGYRVGVDDPGRWVEILNTDSDVYGGSGMGNLGGVETDSPDADSEKTHSLALTLPPLSVVVLRRLSDGQPG
jgi:1,4-alpha-glucan branching enzyme